MSRLQGFDDQLFEAMVMMEKAPILDAIPGSHEGIILSVAMSCDPRRQVGQDLRSVAGAGAEGAEFRPGRPRSLPPRHIWSPPVEEIGVVRRRR